MPKENIPPFQNTNDSYIPFTSKYHSKLFTCKFCKLLHSY